MEIHNLIISQLSDNMEAMPMLIANGPLSACLLKLSGKNQPEELMRDCILGGMSYQKISIRSVANVKNTVKDTSQVGDYLVEEFV